MSNGAVLPHVRLRTRALLNGHLPVTACEADLENYIIASHSTLVRRTHVTIRRHRERGAHHIPFT